MARYSTAEALRQILQEDTDSDEDIVADGEVNSEDGDYLPGGGADSDTEDHVSEESEVRRCHYVRGRAGKKYFALCVQTVGSFSVSVICNLCYLQPVETSSKKLEFMS